MTATDALHYLPVTELSELIAERRLAPSELMSAVIARAEEVNPKLNALVAQRFEAATREAAAADNEPSRGVLHGIPITLKDLAYETPDLPSTYGSRAFADYEPGFETVVGQRLRTAGTIAIGRTNSPEFGLTNTCESAQFGPTSNPWRPEHTPGGSSGGAGAAVATGIAPLAAANDGGGSCRVPASSCGVVGLKPSRGRVPWAPTSYEWWAGFATNGPIARTVEDVALLLDAMSGPVVGEPYGVPAPSESFLTASRRRPGPLRIAFSCTPPKPHDRLNAEVKQTFLAAVANFEALGHTVTEIDHGLDGIFDSFIRVIAANTALSVTQTVPLGSLNLLEPNTLGLAQRGWGLSAMDYCEAINHLRTTAALSMARWTEDFDVLLTPTLTDLPPLTGQMPSYDGDLDACYLHMLGHNAFTYPFNVTGQPALSIPCGWSTSGLPIGLQIIGGMGQEARVLALAAAYEEAHPWAARKPPL